MRVLDLFSGIGGFSLGLRMAGGFETVQFVEIDPWCRQVLAKNFPGVPIHDDIKTFKGVAAEVVTAGWPCQTYSTAARGRNNYPDMWPFLCRVIEEIRPLYFIGENVGTIDHSPVQLDLQNIGYRLEVHRFRVPFRGHLRDRKYFVAYPDCDRKPYLPLNVEMARLLKVAGVYPPNPAIYVGVDDGIPRRVDRLRGLGNAVVPQVVAEIGKAISAAQWGSRSARE